MRLQRIPKPALFAGSFYTMTMVAQGLPVRFPPKFHGISLVGDNVIDLSREPHFPAPVALDTKGMLA
jgi:hypothetical protein